MTAMKTLAALGCWSWSVSDVTPLYDRIPAFRCKPGCGDCCGVVPWSENEWAKVADRAPPGTTTIKADDAIIPTRPGSSVCPFFSSGCTVYNDRPFMCRLFGAVRDPRLRCPHGCGPTHPLSAAKALKMTRQYYDKRHV
jgi:hypothetical protein